MSCLGQRTCLDPGSYCPENKFRPDACFLPSVTLRYNPGSFAAGVPNVPAVLEPIFTLECPSDMEVGVVISPLSGQSFYRTTDPIFNQRYRARLFVFQANDPGPYTITLSNNTFSPYITASRSFGTFWQTAGTVLTFNVASSQTGPITVEVTTVSPQTYGSFDLALACAPVSECVAGATGSVDLSGAAAYWKMDEASGAALDATGNGYNLLEVLPTIGSTPGLISNARSFAAAVRELEIGPGAPTIDLIQGLSMVGWVRFNTFSSGTASHPMIYQAFDATVNLLYQFDFNPSSVFRFVVAGEGPISQTILGPSISLGTWYMISFVYSRVTGKTCIKINDGSLFTSLTTIPINFVGTQANNRIFPFNASSVGSRAFDIDEMGLWRRRLTGGSITDLYNAGVGKTYPF